MSRRFAHADVGFSLIELMVALVAGLIVLGATLAFIISSVRANSEFIQSTRVGQEVRSVGEQVSRELRRAGFDQAFIDQLARLAGSSAVSSFAPILLTGGGTDTSCVIFAYDRAPFNATTRAGTVDLSNGEVRGLRRRVVTVNGQSVGVIEVAESVSGAAPACADASADYTAYPPACNGRWCPLSDPRSVDIQSFRLDYVSQNVALPVTDLTSLRTRVRRFDMTISGVATNDTLASSSVESSIRIRAECLRTSVAMTAGACELAPVGI